MAARTSPHPGSGEELEIEIIDPAVGAGPGENRRHGTGSEKSVAVVAQAADPPLSVWIDDLRESVDDVLAPARRVSESSGLAAGSWLHRRGVARKQRVADRNPRSQSRIRLHVFIPYAAACSRTPGIGVIAQTRAGKLALDGPFDEHRAGRRAPGTLTLRGSWPGLPVWIDLEPWWRQQTIVTLSLRSTNRLRYPRRYFSGSHRLLRRFVATLAGT